MEKFAFLFLFVYAVSAKGQSVVTLTGAPFSATWTLTTDVAGVVTTTKAVAARSSNGSVYYAIFKDGKPDVVVIDDVARETEIQVRLQMKQYMKAPARPNGRFVTRTMEEQHAILKHGNAAYTRQAGEQKKESTPLGVKVIDGMTLYGSHYVRTRDDVRTMEGDTWQSDLGFIYSSRDEILRQKKTVTWTLAEIKRSEPHASLFIVPSGYALVPRWTW